jgi:Tol biopolymer transport system component
MQLSAGSRLGPYEIVSAIGAGGMGEVWRARDTRLGREVAIKVLPQSFAASEQLRARFEREARTISALNHPNICTLHDVGHESGHHYLVMELIDGESLADRISRGPLPLSQVIRYGAEIATALDTAHRQGVVHRDLKPGNVMITRAGAKLLDFGLATPSPANTIGDDATAKMPLTEEGTIVGTVQYMAPEQLEGAPADARTDIFALGLVLYEMATGRRAFEGRTKMSVVASILSSEPRPLSETLPLAPASLWRVIQLCLRKDREERWQSAHDVRLELEGILGEASQTKPPRRSRLAWAAGIAALVALSAAGAYFAGRSTRPARIASAAALNLTPPNGGFLFDAALSPDGRMLAMTVVDGPDEAARLWLRDLTTGDQRVFEGTSGAAKLFWSPDGESVGFVHRDTTLRRVNIRSGALQTICSIAEPSGATWGSRGIVFSQNGRLFRVDPAGGDPQPLPYAGDHKLVWPWFLPDGEQLLVMSDGGPQAPSFIGVLPLDGKTSPRELVRATSNASYVAPGSLLYVKGRTLLSQPFDPSSARTTGEAVPVAHQVDDNDFAQHVFTGAANGTLCYRSRDVRSVLRLRDRAGKELATFGEPADWAGIVISPDGTRAIAERVDEDRRNGRLWVVDLTRGSVSRFGDLSNGWQVLGTWAPDGQRFAFLSNHEGPFRLYEASVNSMAIRRLSDMGCHPQGWAGDWISCEGALGQGTANDVLLVSASTGTVVPVATTRDWENGARISPDGRWIAYSASQGAGEAVFVQPVPPDGRRWEIATGRVGGPTWSPDGKTVFVGGADTLYSIAIDTAGSSLRSGPMELVMRRKVKHFKNRWPSAMLGNGEKFLLNEPVDDRATVHVVVQR